MKIIVIGGGASGMMAAIAAAKNGADVSIIEKNERIGKKILATGNGKCNLTNLDFSLNKYNSSSKELLEQYFEMFNEKSTIAFFGECGLMLKNKSGYIYPMCEQASAVLDVLRHMIDVFGIKVITEAGALDIINCNEGFVIKTDKGDFHANKIILACGSSAGLSKKDKSYSGKTGYELAKTIGHSIITPLPSLVQIECEEDFFDSIAGVRVDANLTLYNDEIALAREYGELQITDYGISGIPVFQLSGGIARRLNKKEKLYVVIDFMPDMEEETFSEFIKGRINSYRGETVESFFLGMLNKKISVLLAKLGGCKLNEIMTDDNADKVYQAALRMKQFVVTVKASRGMDNAQVCSGGIPLNEVNAHLQSTKNKNVYFCGEMLDVDGRCGGYNLQWAWTSGYIAGSYAAVEKC